MTSARARRRPDCISSVARSTASWRGRRPWQGTRTSPHAAALPALVRVGDGAPRARPALLRAAGADAVQRRPGLLSDDRAAARLPPVRAAHEARDRVRRQPARAGVTFDGSPACCHATTRKGTACQRVPLPGSKYCPSHKHLEEEFDERGQPPEATAAELASAVMILGVDVGGTFTDAVLLDRRRGWSRPRRPPRPTTSPRACMAAVREALERGGRARPATSSASSTA